MHVFHVVSIALETLEETHVLHCSPMWRNCHQCPIRAVHKQALSSSLLGLLASRQARQAAVTEITDRLRDSDDRPIGVTRNGTARALSALPALSALTTEHGKAREQREHSNI